jgi:GNAT superfamily N-acetyltransferase
VGVAGPESKPLPRDLGAGLTDLPETPLEVGSEPNHDLGSVPIAAVRAHDLRRRLLRAGAEDAEVSFEGDEESSSVHLGAFAGAALVAVASLIVRRFPDRPGVAAIQLRGMAVEEDLQMTGVGRVLLERARQVAKESGASILWANARTAALGFYLKEGMVSAGSDFYEPTTGLFHRRVWVML